ncbi:unnamed protein product [Lactuca virosa]|uniref:Uncharacterized protein n=1 Tax=Lactuca virosa TaxID=75947 RepID=A0AAU9LS14_9ASTR|nr:unnamed protein product [Lactuca virosa]
MTALKIVGNDATLFPIVARILDSMHNLVDPKNQLPVQYLASIDSTPTRVLPEKVSQKVIEGPSKGSKAQNTKKKAEKPKEGHKAFVKETIPMKTSKGVLKRIMKPSKKTSDFATTKPTQEPDPVVKTDK